MSALVRRATQVFAMALVAGVGLTAAPAQASEPAQLNANCEMLRVNTDHVGVHENPDTNSVIRKYKNSGDLVQWMCVEYHDVEGATWFKNVQCSCATDGEGWIIENYLSLP